VTKRSFKALKFKKKRTLQIERFLNKSIEAGDYYLVTIVDEEGHNNDPKPKNNKYVWKSKVTIQ
jgi:hypothetical protein